MALDQEFPYTLREWTRDVSRWCAATKVTPERQGPLLALAVGGAGRVAVDGIYDDLLKRDNDNAPHAELYIAGFTCQPFSTANSMRKGV